MTYAYKYTGKGERYRGVPARDLTQQEYDDLGVLEKRAVDESGAYTKVKAKADKSNQSDKQKDGE